MGRAERSSLHVALAAITALAILLGNPLRTERCNGGAFT